MTEIYLFDWGDTLMVDFPDESGKMCDWEKVEVVDGAFETLRALSRNHHIYLATNAEHSSEDDIEAAFHRVGLSAFIRGYFCNANLGIGKGTPEYFHKVLSKLDIAPCSIVMVGDSLEKDIHPAVEAGIQAVWFNPLQHNFRVPQAVRQVKHLSELLI